MRRLYENGTDTNVGEDVVCGGDTMVMKMMLTAGCDGDAMTLHVGEHAGDDEEDDAEPLMRWDDDTLTLFDDDNDGNHNHK